MGKGWTRENNGVWIHFRGTETSVILLLKVTHTSVRCVKKKKTEERRDDVSLKVRGSDPS